MIRSLENFCYEISEPEGIWLLRETTGSDIFWVDATEIDLQTLEGQVLFFDRHLLQGPNLQDLTLGTFGKVLGQFTTQSKIMESGQWLELIYLLSGQVFNPNWQQWLGTPLSVLEAMSSVVKKHPRQVF